MPGLAALRARAGDIEIAYSELPDGGRPLFTSSEPQLVATLHDWGRAHVFDHGAHAEHGA